MCTPEPYKLIEMRYPGKPPDAMASAVIHRFFGYLRDDDLWGHELYPVAGRDRLFQALPVLERYEATAIYKGPDLYFGISKLRLILVGVAVLSGLNETSG